MTRSNGDRCNNQKYYEGPRLGYVNEGTMSQNENSRHWEEYYSTVIQKGLKAALADLSIDKSFDEIDNGHIKLNKLMYVAMAERNLYRQMQHSWHRYGGDLGTLVPNTHTVKPVLLDQLPQTEQPRHPSVDYIESSVWDEQDYCEFFKQVSIGSLDSLAEILEADRATLLEEFYMEYRSDIEEWADLYLLNIEIQKTLHLYAEDNLEQFNSEEYLDFVDTIDAFEQELYSHQELSPSSLETYDIDLARCENPADLLSDFLEFVDDIHFVISETNMSEFDGDLSHPLSTVEEFYHEYAWNVVTKVISLNTTCGLNQSALVNGSISDLESLIDRYSIRMGRVESECRAANLLPDNPEPAEPEEIPSGSELDHQLPTQAEFRQALRGSVD